MADYKIKWNGLVDDSESDSLVSADNNEVPTSVDIVWSGYKPVWYSCYDGTTFTQANCASGVMDNPVYLEDYDLNGDGVLTADDSNLWWHPVSAHADRLDIMNTVREFVLGNEPMPDKAPKKTYTWGDVAFVLEIFDGIGTGSRRAREKRLQDLDKEKKKKLIRLICRVKGEEKAYDETKEVGDIQLKLDDVDMVINKVIGTMKVSTEWEEVPWDYKYDK